MIEALLKLQAIHLEIDSIQSDAQVFPDRLEEVQKNLDTKKRKYDENKTRIQALKAELGDMNTTLGLEEQRLVKSRKKVNEITKSYEYQAMKKEIEATERSNVTLADQIKSKSLEIEKAETEFQAIEETYKAAEAVLTSVQSEVNVKVGEFNGVLQLKLDEASLLEKQCDPSLLSKYKLIRLRKCADAIVGVIKGACQGCFINIPPQMANLMLRRRERIETCPNCQRLIYWHEEK